MCPSVAIFLVCLGFVSLLLCEDWMGIVSFSKAVDLEIQKSTNQFVFNLHDLQEQFWSLVDFFQHSQIMLIRLVKSQGKKKKRHK